jgi:hypothetical protein
MARLTSWRTTTEAILRPPRDHARRHGGAPQITGLPDAQLSYENNWGRLSQYAIDVTNNSAIAPRTIGSAGTLSNFGQVAQFLSTMLGVPSEETGSTGHDEP